MALYKIKYIIIITSNITQNIKLKYGGYITLIIVETYIFLARIRVVSARETNRQVQSACYTTKSIGLTPVIISQVMLYDEVGHCQFVICTKVCVCVRCPCVREVCIPVMCMRACVHTTAYRMCCHRSKLGSIQLRKYLFNFNLRIFHYQGPVQIHLKTPTYVAICHMGPVILDFFKLYGGGLDDPKGEVQMHLEVLCPLNYFVDPFIVNECIY